MSFWVLYTQKNISLKQKQKKKKLNKRNTEFIIRKFTLKNTTIIFLTKKYGSIGRNEKCKG